VQPLVHALTCHEAINEAGRLFVITDRGTFSAAANLAARIERHTHAVFVGEPPSARPNLYGDPEQFTLPASGIRVAISGLYWQESDPRDRRPWVRPDVPVRMSYDQYASGRDPALQAILAFDPSEAPEALTGPPNQHWARPGQDRGWTVVTAE
jgi:C-terminal processing protease CtpA/Prc